MGNSHERRLLRRMKKAVTQEGTGHVSTEKVGSPIMSRQVLDKRSLALSILWTTGISVVLILISQVGTIPPWAIVLLVFVGAICFSISAWLHGWTKQWTKRFLLFAAIWGGLGALGWRVKPQPKVAAIEMKISPSGFPISIPPHSTTSILRINPNRILDGTGDYLLKADNTRGADVTWPSLKETDSEKPGEYETVFRVQVANHSLETLVKGKLSFRIVYNSGSPVGCTPSKGTEKHQDDVILLPQLDPGKIFEFYAVNESSMCAWFIPPDKATVRMMSDEMDRHVLLPSKTGHLI